MNIVIDGFDFWNMPAMKYYAPPATWDVEKKKENAMNKIFSNQWLASRKRDGAWMMFIKDMNGNLYLRPRTQNVKKEFINKIDWVPHLHNFFNEIDPGTVFLGELYAPWDEQAKTTTSIMNCLLPKALKRQESEDRKLHYYIFDVLAENGKSYLDMKAEERFDKLNSFERAYGEHYHEWAQYFYGEELWQQLQEILADGGEGMVIINEDSVYHPGKRSNSVSLKIKKELQDTIDCVIMGANPPTKLSNTSEPETWSFWFNELTNMKVLEPDFLKDEHKTIYQAYEEGAPVVPVTKGWFFGWAGSLKLGLYDGDKLVHVGDLSGITEEVRKNWKDYIGTVVEISCMEISEDKEGNKGFRHPRAINFMRDKNPKDCTMEQIK